MASGSDESSDEELPVYDEALKKYRRRGKFVATDVAEAAIAAKAKKLKEEVPSDTVNVTMPPTRRV